jgi:hypothetical protein
LITAVLLLISAAPAQTTVQYSDGYYPQAAPSALSPHDQQQFDKYYAKWVDATRKNDQDDIAGNARHMEEIMARYNIPSNVPFAQIASNGGYAAYPNGAYPQGAYSPYPAYAGRLSPGDQQKFDAYYAKWVDATRRNDQDDIVGNAGHMQEIMARYNIPGNTPFQAIASNGYAVNGYPAAAPNPAYAYPYGQPQRLSAKDQKDFDNAYRHWVDARRKRDMDDVDKNASKMQQIMARYNIPANVPFDQIATQGAAYH